MKIFGHYLFEDDPELKDYLQEKEQRRRREIARICETGENDPYAQVLPNVECGDTLLSEKEEARFFLNIHREMASQGECHKFNGKKYCYHTGKEIVIDLTEGDEVVGTLGGEN